MSKENRVEQINCLIEVISSIGRRFFHTEGTIAHMKLKRGHIYFVDDYTKEDVRVLNNQKDWSNFSHSGTIHALVLDFADFIRTGEPSNGKHGYRGLLSRDWGCSESEHDEMIAFAKTIGFVQI